MNKELYDKIRTFLQSKLEERDFKKVSAYLEEGMTEAELDSGGAMDAARNVYGNAAVRSVRRYNDAVKKTRGVLGENHGMALDSAEAVYGAALRRVGHDLTGVQPSSFEFVFDNAGRAPARDAGLSRRLRDQTARESPASAKRLSGITQL